MSFPQYPAYRDSGVAWVGEIPEHWESVLARRLFASRREPAQDGDEQLTASQKYGVIPQKLFMDLEEQKVALALSGTESFRHVEANDFVISLRSFQGGIEHSRYSGCVSPAYTVLQPVEAVGPKYFSYLLKCAPFVAALQSMTDGLRDGKAISYGQFASLCLPLPSRTEQAAIAAFLDRETAKIDALVAEQRRLMDLLREQRQAVISHAVTKGLNPDAPMKDSGVEWLGEVPAHWKVGKIGFYTKILSGFAFPSTGFSDDSSQTRLLRGINVGVSTLKWDDTVYWIREEGDGLSEYALEPGDLVIGMDRPLISEGMRVALVKAEDTPCLLLQRVASLRTADSLSVRFLQFLLSSPMFVAHFAPETTGVSVPHISPQQIGNFVAAIPPREEQDEIVARIDRTCSDYDSLIDAAAKSIDLLAERRAALVTAAVTGQIDVRDLALSEAA